MKKSRDFLWIMTIAAAIRLAVIVFLPSLHHPDENFQFLEQAHRIAFGYGIQTWEFSEGMRSLLFPYLIAKFFSLTNLIFGDRQMYIPITRALLAALSLLSVAAAYTMGLRRSRTHALLVGIVAATWFEIVYFSVKSLSEAMATDFLIIALSLASFPDEAASRRRLLAIGFCVSMCLMLRVHLAPGLLVIVYWMLKRDGWRRLPYLLAGGLPPLIAFGIADYVTWGSPFYSYIAAVRVNVIQDVASHFGTHPRYWFAQRVVQIWAGAFPLVAVLILLRWRESKLWVLTAVIIIAVHSFIPHKEDRFVFPAHACLIIVAALASADLLAKWRQRFSAQQAFRATAAVILFWCGTSVSLAIAPGFVENWSNGRDLIKAFTWLHGRPDLCGLLLLDNPWFNTGGYAYLHRQVPIYDSIFDAQILSGGTRSFNYVVASRGSLGRIPSDYTAQQCYGGKAYDICVVARPGSCEGPEGATALLDRRRLGEQ